MVNQGDRAISRTRVPLTSLSTSDVSLKWLLRYYVSKDSPNISPSVSCTEAFRDPRRACTDKFASFFWMFGIYLHISTSHSHQKRGQKKVWTKSTFGRETFPAPNFLLVYRIETHKNPKLIPSWVAHAVKFISIVLGLCTFSSEARIPRPHCYSHFQ